MKVTDTVSELARPVVEKLGLTLWDVEYVKEGGERYLRVFIDKDGGVSSDDCEAVSRALDPLLDEADPIEDHYIFEVSSAGIERPLKRPSDFEKFMGSKIYISLYRSVNGAREHTGLLRGYDDGAVEAEVNGSLVRFEKKDVALVRLSI